MDNDNTEFDEFTDSDIDDVISKLSMGSIKSRFKDEQTQEFIYSIGKKSSRATPSPGKVTPSKATPPSPGKVTPSPGKVTPSKSKEVSLNTVVIPKEFDYYLIKLTHQEYKHLMTEIKDAGVSDDTVKKLKKYKAIKGNTEYIWK